MQADSEGFGGWFRWTVGILVALIAAGAGWAALFMKHPKPPAPQPPAGTVANVPQQSSCTFEGQVFDQDTQRPLAAISVGYYRLTSDPTSYLHGVRSRLAVTSPDGRFHADCGSLEVENFPLRLELTSPHWCSSFQTNDYIPRTGQSAPVIIYVRDTMLQHLAC